MEKRRRIEVFSAGCPVCEETVALARRLACPDCEVTVLAMSEPAVAARARELAVRSVPAVAVDERLVACCAGRGPDEATLRAAGLGQRMR
jgi:hypothetical protein